MAEHGWGGVSAVQLLTTLREWHDTERGKARDLDGYGRDERRVCQTRAPILNRVIVLLEGKP